MRGCRTTHPIVTSESHGRVTSLPHLQGGVIPRDGEYRGVVPSPEGEEDPGRHSHRAGGTRPPAARRKPSGQRGRERPRGAVARCLCPHRGPHGGRRRHRQPRPPVRGGLVAFPQGALAPDASPSSFRSLRSLAPSASGADAPKKWAFLDAQKVRHLRRPLTVRTKAALADARANARGICDSPAHGTRRFLDGIPGDPASGPRPSQTPSPSGNRLE